VGEDDLRGQGDLVARLAAVVPIVVFTAARRLRGDRGRPARPRGVFPTREVDPTGAGDVFAAGSCSRSRADALRSRPLASARRQRRSSWKWEGDARAHRRGFERVERVPVLG
jgi:hypothetical protein